MSHEKSHEKFKYESRMASEDAAGFLETLAAGLRQHEVLLESGNDSVSLRVADEVTFECSANENLEKQHGGFTLSVEWHAASHEGARTLQGMHITSGSTDDEESLAATHVADRTARALRPVAASAQSSAPTTATKMAPAAPEKLSSRRPMRPSTAPRTRAAKTKVATRKPVAAPAKASSRATRTSARGRSPARRRAAP